MKKIALALAVASVALAVSAAVPYKLGIAGYTFCKKNLDESLAIMKAIDCHYLCIKDFHLGYGADDAKIAEYKAKIAEAGVESLAAGPLYCSNEDEIRNFFEFAKRYGLKVLVGVPFEMKEINGKKTRVESDAVLDIVERYVKEYDVKFAIHNHGPDIPYLFPTGEAVMKRIAGRDKRIGMCLDVGHERRAGLDPAAFIRANGDRIYDVHLKNIIIDAQKNRAMEGPRGQLDIPSILQALADVGYDGVCHIEYEKDFADNAMPLAESVGYYRGCMDSIKTKAVMAPVPAGANTLTAEEKTEGYELLFDGKSLPADKWVGVKSKCTAFPEVGWFVKDGCITMRPKSGIANGKWFPLPPEDAKLGGGGDIVTIKKYRDFAFKFDFRLTEAANSGVKYFYDENVNKGTCEEYQVLDAGHPDSTKGKDGNRRVAALYDIFPANAESVLKPVGQWNSGMIVSKGTKVEHWLNGTKVLEYDRASKKFADGVAVSKYATWGVDAAGKPQPWGMVESGRLLLQDHSDSTVSFCNLKVKEL